MSKDQRAYLFGLIGFIIGIFMILIMVGPDNQKRYRLKTACEQNLPRNQECELQYIPSKVTK